MSDEENLTGHEYDGIQEYDNPLPAWWLWTFLITIIFGFLYWIHYEFGGGQTQYAELDADLAAIHRLQKNAPMPADNEDELLALMNSSEALNKGQQVYVGKCAVCHGPDLQGLIGPNLVDEYWINGKGKISDISAVVRRGVTDKGMPTWNGILNEDEIRSVAVFIAKKRGSQPSNPKAPQGEKVVQN